MQEAYQLRAGSRRREAACEQGGATADLSDDLVQVRRFSRIAEVTRRRQLQQGGRIGAHSGDREEAGPALDPAGTGSGPERRWEAGSAVPHEVAEDGGGFSTEAPANLDPDNDETRPSRARGLGGRRSRRRRSTRRCSEGRATAADVGSTVRARPEWGPDCESSSARDAVVWISQSSQHLEFHGKG